MITKYFYSPNCGFCDQVQLPEEGIVKIDVSSPDYIGFVPTTPTIQLGAVVLQGPEHINAYFQHAKHIK